MAPPSLADLLEASQGRAAELDAQCAKLKEDLAGFDRQVAEKRAEKTIAAQNAVRELLKQREAASKQTKTLEAAADHVQAAVRKLECAQAAGVDDWRDLREEKVTLSEFAQRRVKEDAQAKARLEASCGGGRLVFGGASIAYVGAAQGLDQLRAELHALESDYQCTVEIELLLLGILEKRGELERVGKKYGAKVAREPGASCVAISGHPDKATKAEEHFRFLVTGHADLPVPKEHAAAARVRAREVETESGSFVDVQRAHDGGFGGGSVIHIRGSHIGVEEAEEMLRSWLDEREHKMSVWVEVGALASLGADNVASLQNDLWHFGQKFGLVATYKEGGGQVEMRGDAAGQWEEAAREEFKQLSAWYLAEAGRGEREKKEAEEAKVRAAAEAEKKAKQAEEDSWGAAPEAEFELGHKW